LIDLLATHASTDKIKVGLPLYIGVYESEGSVKDAWNYIKQFGWGTETKDSDFWHVQKLSDNTIQDAIMASAALPFLFQSRAVRGKSYRDGGMGGSFHQQGNTPIQPLVDSGCNYVIVSLLDDGSSFDRHKYPNTTIIEVRPKNFISESMTDMVAFEPEKIDIWMEQGYQDAKRCIGNVIDAMKGIKHNQQSAKLRYSVLDSLESDSFKI